MSAAAVARPAVEPNAPPQNLEAEESILGAMLLSPGAIAAVGELVTASDFYLSSHGVIFRTAISLYSRGEPVDSRTSRLVWIL